MVDDLVEVELDDELDGPGWAPRTPRPPWTARAWCRLSAVLAVVVAAGAMQDAARAASLAELTAQAAHDLRVERAAQWSVEGSLVGVAGDVVLVAGSDDTLAAYRWMDGRWLWGARGVADCTVVGLDDERGTAAPVTRDRPVERSRAVCSVVAPDDAHTSGVAVLDPADGRWLLAQEPAGAATSWAVDQGRIFTVRGEGPDGSPGQVAAASLDTGTTAWRSALTAPLNGWYLTDGWLVLQGVRRALDLATGRAGDPTVWGGEVRHALGGGTTAVAGWDPSGAFVTTTVLDADGRDVWRRHAYYAAPALTLDASVLPVITLAGTLAGLDAATGEQLWSGALPGPLVAAVDGVLVCAESVKARVGGATGPVTDWVGVDLRTGTTLWQFRAADPTGAGEPALVTDGERFAVGAPAGWVEVRDLRSGAVVARWDTGVGEPSTVVPLPQGRVAEVTATRVVVLGP